MKFTDLLVNKIGSDKLLHYLVAGWITTLASVYGYKYMIIMSITILALNIFKEVALDDEAEPKDVIWAFYGCVSSFIFYAFYIFTHS